MALPTTREQAADLLGLPADAPTSVINARYRTLAQAYHPDLNPGLSTGDRRMRELTAAWELLAGHHPAGPPDGERPEPVRRRPSARQDGVKAAMHQMPYGVYVIGTTRDGEPNGMVADWVMQIAFEPRFVAVSFENNSYSLDSVRANRAFTVNLLPEEGMDLAARFLQPRDGSKIGGRSAEGAGTTHHKLEGAAYQITKRGCPILDEALSWFECEAEQFIPIGDHTLVIGRVLNGDVCRTADPLTSLYTGWVYSG